MPDAQHFSRRTVLGGAGAFLAAGVLAACSRESNGGASGSGGTNAALTGRPLPIPPLAEGTSVGDEMVYELTAQTGTSRLLADHDTPTWGFNGAYLGPTIRMRSGRKVRVNVRNALPDVTTVHWHGMHLPAQFDGGPHQEIQPGASWSPSWTVRQQAATLWYHPHPHGQTSKQAYRGLAGMLIIDDDNAQAQQLPHDYGVDDIPLVLQDKRFTSNGGLDETDLKDLGLLGDTPVVNGVVGPHFAAGARRLRLRVLNGAVMRVFNLHFDDGREFLQVGSDGGLLDVPRTRTTLALSPGERCEIILDLKPGDKVTLRSVRFDDNLKVRGRGAPDFGLQDEFDLMTIQGPAQGGEPAALALSGFNSTDREVPDLANARTRTMELKWFQINGRQMDMKRVDEIIDHHGYEIWHVRNVDDWIHNFHIHDTQFKVLDMDGASPHVRSEGWKDTILLNPGASARLVVRFEDFESNEWPYMHHCHLLFHEDQGMMGQFMVVAPGQQPTNGFTTAATSTRERGSGGDSSDSDSDRGSGTRNDDRSSTSSRPGQSHGHSR